MQIFRLAKRCFYQCYISVFSINISKDIIRYFPKISSEFYINFYLGELLTNERGVLLKVKRKGSTSLILIGVNFCILRPIFIFSPHLSSICNVKASYERWRMFSRFLASSVRNGVMVRN